MLRHKVDQELPEYADHTFSTMDEALAFAPHITVIANPAPYHLSTAMPLVKAGVHLLVEKPLSVSSHGVAELLNVSANNKSLLLTGYNLRYLLSLQKFKFMLDEQTIGAVWMARCEVGQYLPSWRPDTNYKDGVSAQRALGGGALLELSHELDYMQWIFGEVDWVQAVLTKQSDLEIDVEDSAHLILGFCAKGSESPVVASVNLDFIRQDTTRTCTVIGKLGSLRWNGLTGIVELLVSGTQTWEEVYRHQAARDESYIAEWRDFVACVEGKTQPTVSGTDGLKVLLLIEAIRLAAKTGSRAHVVRVHGLPEP